MYRRVGKPLLDTVLAAAALAVLAPLLAGVAALVRLRLGSPVIFWQERAGLKERSFHLCKFRTMTDARDDVGQLLPDARRLTPFGAWLRRTSLDELPELWNVLRSQMSLVGPRPLLVDYLPHYTSEQRRRHVVRPGLTGWAQIHGRNRCGWDERLAMDVWYVDHVSLALDLRILGATIASVLTARGVSHEGHATMPRFDEGRHP